ncbi:MAG: hypothetical protein IJI05_04075, partial [Erysipelotrichaceae bacterium]|nr:hypothetical protein [Erysipelotrichaceae bacterium]
MITGQLDKSVVAGYNVTIVFYDICATFGNAFCLTGSVVLGMTLGRNDLDEARRQANSIIFIALCAGVVLGLFTFTAKDVFISFYSLSEVSREYA